MELFMEGAVVGLSAGFSCLATCLPALAPLSLASAGGTGGLLRVLLPFLAGRGAGYLAFCLLAVAAGKVFSGSVPGWVPGAALGVSGLVMLAAAAVPGLFPGGRCARYAAPGAPAAPVLLGLLTGLGFCPPFAAALVRLAGLGQYLPALAYFAGFFLATSLYLLPAALPALGRGERFRNIGRMAMVIAGLWYAAAGFSSLLR